MEEVLNRMGSRFEEMGLEGMDAEALKTQFRERLAKGDKFEADTFLNTVMQQAASAGQRSTKLTDDEKKAQNALRQAGADISAANEKLIQYLDERRKELGVEKYGSVDLAKTEEKRDEARTKEATEKKKVDDLAVEKTVNEVEDVNRRTQIKANEAARGANQDAIGDTVASADTGIGTSTSPVVVSVKPPVGGVAGSTGAAGAAGPAGGATDPAGVPFSITNVPIVGGQPGVAPAQVEEAKKGLTTGGAGGGLLGSLKQGLQSLLPSGDTIKSAVSGISEAVAKGRSAAGAGPVKTGTGEQIAGIDKDIRAREEQQERFKAQAAKGRKAQEEAAGTLRYKLAGEDQKKAMLSKAFRGAAGQSEEMLAGQVAKGEGELGDIQKSKEQLVQQKIFEDAMINVGIGGDKSMAAEAIKTGTDAIVAQLKTMETIMGAGKEEEEKSNKDTSEWQNEGWQDPAKAQEATNKGNLAAGRGADIQSFSSMYGYTPELTTAALAQESARKQEEARKKAEQGAADAGLVGATAFEGDSGEAWGVEDSLGGFSAGLPGAAGEEEKIRQAAASMGGGAGAGGGLQEQVEKLGEIFGNALQVEVGGMIDVNVNMNGAEALNGAKDAFGKLASEKATDAINNFIDSMSRTGTGRPQKKSDWAGGGDNGSQSRGESGGWG